MKKNEMGDQNIPAGLSAEDQKEYSKLVMEEARLRLEDLRMRVENERARRNQIKHNQKVQQETLDKANEDIIASQRLCKHRKGGKDQAGILNGHDNNRSIIKNTYPWGEKTAMCTRCTKEWTKPSEELKKTDRKMYDKQMAEYIEVMSWPTDNEESGSQLFMITRPAA